LLEQVLARVAARRVGGAGAVVDARARVVARAQRDLGAIIGGGDAAVRREVLQVVVGSGVAFALALTFTLAFALARLVVDDEEAIVRAQRREALRFGAAEVALRFGGAHGLALGALFVAATRQAIGAGQRQRGERDDEGNGMTTSKVHGSHGGGTLPHADPRATVTHAGPGVSGADAIRLKVVATMTKDDEQGDQPVEAVALAAAPYLTRGVELTELLGALVDAVVRQVGCEKGTLYLVDGAAQTLTSIVADVPAEIGVIKLAVGQGIAGTVAREAKPVRIPDAQTDPRFDSRFDKQTGFVTRSVLAVPMFDANKDVIGVLQLLNKKSGTFTLQDEATTMPLAKQAGSVLERTSLYAELKRKSPLKDADRPRLAFRFNQIVGESDVMKRVYELVEKAAPTDATVLVTGESGTGKELIARAIHQNSKRKGGQPFVKVDCTTLPEALMENELFGHEKGAFTGADRTVPGKLEAAHGGTLFIDEIGELPLKLQGKLLRVLQDRELERVGGTKTIAVDIRVVCATHRDLEQMVTDGTFREDLFYRIRVVPIAMPPLRERGQADLLRLISHFVDKFGRRHGRPSVDLSDEARNRLLGHSYPGNIRELEHIVESAVVLCDGDVIHPRDLSLPTKGRPSTGTTLPGVMIVGDPNVTLAHVENEHIRLVVQACAGNQSEAARKLGIGRNTLARKLSGAAETHSDDE
jgi:transcriptional regulator with GAF, ATPase, and Fis domain